MTPTLSDPRRVAPDEPRGPKGGKRSHRTTGYLLGLGVLFAMVVLPLLYHAESYRADRTGLLSVVSFLAIGGITLGNIAATAFRRPFSLNIAHWTFMLIFFFIAPLVQHLTGRVPGQADPSNFFGPSGLWDKHHLLVNLAVIGWCTAYSLVYALVSRAGGPETQPPKRSQMYNPWLLGLLVLVAFALLAATLGSRLISLRGAQGAGADAAVEVTSAGLGLIIQTSVRAIPFAVLMLLLSVRARNAAYLPVLLLSGGLAFLLSNPLSVARFAFGAVVISVLCIFLRRRQASALWIPISILFAMFFVMPLLNIGRGTTISEGVQRVKYENYLDRVTSGDFDAYAMMLNAVEYVEDGPGPRNGLGLGSAVLFLVPRNAWPGRSQGSGIDLAEHYRFQFTNLSCPLPAEGYLDFGFIGVIAYGMLFAGILAKLDSMYWTASPNAAPVPTWYAITYPFLIGQVIILMRGSLHPILAFTLSTVVTTFLVSKVAVIGVRRRPLPPLRSSAGSAPADAPALSG